MFLCRPGEASLELTRAGLAAYVGACGLVRWSSLNTFISLLNVYKHVSVTVVLREGMCACTVYAR